MAWLFVILKEEIFFTNIDYDTGHCERRSGCDMLYIYIGVQLSLFLPIVVNFGDFPVSVG